MDFFKNNFIEFVTILLLVDVLVLFIFLAVGSLLPEQGSNLPSLHWKAKS